MFEPADIILINSGTRIGKAILFVLRLFQKDPIAFHHVILAVDDKLGIEAEVYGVSYCNLSEKLNKAKSYKVIRYKDLSEDKKEKIVMSVNKLVGVPYGYRRLILQLLDQMFFTNFFTRSLGDKKCQVCSSLVAWSYYVWKRIKFNSVPWQSCEPDDIDDESLRTSDLWEIIKQVNS